MNLVVDYFENKIEINYDKVVSIEILNKKFFYRFIYDLNDIYNGLYNDKIHLFNFENKEINISNIIKLYIDYFNLDLNSKKYTTDYIKYILSTIDENDKDNLVKNYNKFIGIFNKLLMKSDITFEYNNECNIDSILKQLKPTVCMKKELFENIILLIDIEKILNTGNILFFVNLKQYLNNEELNEIMKYSIYNSIRIILIDSFEDKFKYNNEKKIIIDNDLDEFVI